jgi:hypothetical protein
MPRAKVDPVDWLSCGAPACSSTDAELEIPESFIDFCEWLGVTLEPGQRVAASVAFDAVEPGELDKDDRAIAVELFGEVDRFAPNARRIVVGVCGARGGKTYVFSALRMLHLALTVSLATLAPGEAASAPIVAPDKDLAAQALNYVTGAIDSKPELAAMVESRGAEHIDLRRPDGHVVEIVVRAASARGRTGRGRSLVGATLEEAAFFRDAEMKVNDDEIFKALSPRVLPGGQVIIESTPWAQIGLLYDLFVANHPNPECAGLTVPARNAGTAIAMHASTLRLRDTELTRAIVAVETDLDPDNAAREFGAQFMAAGTETFFDPLTLAKCVDPEIEIPFLPEPGDEVTSGGDLGFAKNSSALAISHRREHHVSLACLIEKKPAEGVLLKPSAVVKEFAAAIVEHQGRYLMADGHYKATAVEHLADVGLGFLDAPAIPAEAFIHVRAGMREGRVHIPNHPRLLRQLRETMARRSSGGVLTIVLPKWKTGEHGDLVVAFVLSVFQAVGDVVKPAKPKAGTREHDEMRASEALERRRADVRRRTENHGWGTLGTRK